MKHFAAIAIKLAISAGLIWYAFSNIDTSSALSEMLALAPVAAVGGLVLIFVQLGVAASRLRQLLDAIGRHLSFPASLDAVLIGAFFSQTLISFVGGDAMRIWRVTRRNIPLGDAARAVLYDRILGFVGLILLIVAGLPVLFNVVQDKRVHAAILVLVGCAVAGSIMLLSLHKLPAVWRRHRVFLFAAELSRMGHELLRAPRRLLVLLGLSIAIQVFNVLILFVVGKGIGAHVDFVAALVLVPPVLFLSMMPISFAGWGVREAAMVAALSAVGVPASQSVAMSICYGLGMIIVSVPGGVLWLYARRPHPETPVQDKPNKQATP